MVRLSIFFLECGTTEKPKALKRYICGPAEEVTKEVQKLPRGMRSSCGNVRTERDNLARPTCRVRLAVIDFRKKPIWPQDDLRDRFPNLCWYGGGMSRAASDEPICHAPSRPR